MNTHKFISKIKSSVVISKYPEVQYYLDEILKEFSPNQVILFGSKARLDADSRSDCDFAIDAEGFVDGEAILGALDIVDIKDVDSELMNKLLKEGVVLYEKKQK